MKIYFNMGYGFEDALYNKAAEAVRTTGNVCYNNWEIVANQNSGRKIFDLKHKKL